MLAAAPGLLQRVAHLDATAAQRCEAPGAAGATVGVHTPATADAGRARPPAPLAGRAA